MKKNKIAALVLAAMIANTSIPSVKAFATELNQTRGSQEARSSIGHRLIIHYPNLYLRMGEKFIARDHITAIDAKGKDVTNSVEVQGNVDTNKPGIYDVKYTYREGQLSVEKYIRVKVISKYDYLSDLNWSKAESPKGIQKNKKGVYGRVNGGKYKGYYLADKHFDKNIVITPNGNLTYNLDGKYTMFEASIGLDKNLEFPWEASVGFEIKGDGKTLAKVNRIQYSDNMAYVKVPVKDVKTLEIVVTDAGDGKMDERVVIGNPKLIVDHLGETQEDINSIEHRLIPHYQDLYLSAGETFRAKDYITVIDANGKDVTNLVEVESNVDTSEKGVYDVKYTYKEGEASVEKYIRVNVVAKYDYLSDLNWSKYELPKTTQKNSPVYGKVSDKNDLASHTADKLFNKNLVISPSGKLTYNLDG